MKIFKRILLALGIIIAAFLIIALFLKSNYTVERSITVNKPDTVVFNYLKYLKNQNDFSVWAQMDPNMEKTYTGTDGTVGFISAWKSDVKDVGQGEQEIKNITSGKRIDYEVRFIEPFPGTSQSYLITDEQAPDQTKVTWGFKGHMAYPTNLMLLFFNMDQAIGNDLQKGLENMKQIVENQ